MAPTSLMIFTDGRGWCQLAKVLLSSSLSMEYTFFLFRGGGVSCWFHTSSHHFHVGFASKETYFLFSCAYHTFRTFLIF
ncbi:hypothetical protein XELAEV_18039563mg [Xenopus laevis]|uniref:Uncharacterized protein n=1 Tax=Xenopus laevis TaxID=8355 RepID=A0A974C7T7_XENLA|nr:hypothetical protein XELAEV_18039563mg [Xenopus laevis]